MYNKLTQLTTTLIQGGEHNATISNHMATHYANHHQVSNHH